MKQPACYCPRAGHRLAWREAQDRQPIVIANTLALDGSRGVIATPGERFDAESVDETGVLTVLVTCPCRDVFEVNVAALFRGESTIPTLVDPDDNTGVRWTRKR